MNESKRFSWKTEKLEHLNDEVLVVVDNTNKEWKGHILNIVDLLNEQQARIKELEEENDILEQKLQTRYIVNKQYEEKERLKKENEQLRRELDGFHPVMFQDMRKGTVVLYSKGDIDG